MTTFVPPALLGSQLGTFYSRGEAIAAAAQLVAYGLGTPTKVRNNGEVTLTVRVVGGNRKVLMRGDLTV